MHNFSPQVKWPTIICASALHTIATNFYFIVVVVVIGWLVDVFFSVSVHFILSPLYNVPTVHYLFLMNLYSIFFHYFVSGLEHTYTHTRSATKCSLSHTIHCIVIKAHMCTQYDIVDSNEQDKAQKPVGWEYTHTTEHIA